MRRLIENVTSKWVKDITKEVSAFQKNYNIWEIQYSLRIGEHVLNDCNVY